MSLNLHQHVYTKGSGSRTLLLLHGTGGDEHDLIPLARSLDTEATILSPRGNINENGALRFFRRLAEGVFDLADVERRTRDLAAWLNSAIDHYKINTSELTAVGYSNGANTIAAMQLLHPNPVRSSILLRAMITAIPPQLPNLSAARVLMLNGERDAIIPLSNAQRLAATFKSAGAKIDQHALPCGHELIADDLRLAHAWLRSQPTTH